jgi:Cu(I)/Ag(I) efflux system membrane fusion protein
MTVQPPTRARLALAAAALAVTAAAAGFGLAHLGRGHTAAPPPPAAAASAKVLYWYDPMVPSQHFDKPGKSPMGMEMVPKYADAAQRAVGVRMDPAAVQNLGMRLATVQRSDFAQRLDATGALDFNQREVAIVQARAAGFVQRVYARAPGDVIAAGAPIADLLVPSWDGAQAEYLAVRRSGNPALETAARQRLRLLGMPEGLIAAIARDGRPRTVVTVTAPVGGAIQTLDVRQGMTVSQGQTLAQLAGLSTVWLNAAVPEAQAGQLRVGAPARAELAAYPGESFGGKVAAVLPAAQTESRTLTARIELANRDGRLKPGMFATIHLDGAARPALFVPSEAVIRTGKRSLVMLAAPGGRYQPVEIRLGREDGDRTEVLAGLDEGDKVVASGQFLIDSEASLSGLDARPLPAAAPPPPAAATINETRGRVEALAGDQITLSHEAVPAIGWPAMTMTMTFTLDPPSLAKGLKVGDRVGFGFEQRPSGAVIRRIVRARAQ